MSRSVPRGSPDRWPGPAGSASGPCSTTSAADRAAPISIPIVALPVAGGFVIPLPFGDDTQWLKNIHGARQAGLRRGGHEYVIDRPELVDLDVVAAELPAPIRFVSRRLGLRTFVRVRQVSRA